MNNVQEIAMDNLVPEALKLKSDDWRFVTLTCVELDEESCDIIYHFDKDLEEKHLRVKVAKTDTVPSLSAVYFCAFLAENEVQDQFNIRFDGLAVDFDRTLVLDEEVTTTPFCRYGVRRTEQ